MSRSRSLALLLTTLAFLMALVAPVSAADLVPVSVTVDGNTLQATAYIVNDRTVAPLRAIFEAVGAVIEWDGPTRTVTARKGTKVIQLTVDKTEAFIDGKPVTLAVSPMIINGSTYVPVRFIVEALDLKVDFDSQTRTVVVKSGLECSLPGGQKHTGTIAPGGETWGLCGSPHIVAGGFRVEGTDSPILTIEAGAVVRFENGASLEIGDRLPGGLLINGTAERPVVLTADTAGAESGFWRGINFYGQTLKGNGTLQHARIEYAGGRYESEGGITVRAAEQRVEITLQNVELRRSLQAGLNLVGNARLSAQTKDLTITETQAVEGKGGYAITTEAAGSHNLPKGKYEGNAFNAVRISSESTGRVEIAENTTWRNLGIPYAIDRDILVGGTSTPTLTLEPGVATLWATGTSLHVGYEQPGTLVAEAAKELGAGHEAALQSAADSLKAFFADPKSTALAQNKAIVFGAWSATPNRGFWSGLHFYDLAGERSKLSGVVVANAGRKVDEQAGIVVEGRNDTPVKIQLVKSLITGAAQSGLELIGTNAGLVPGSTGNILKGNGWPIRLEPQHIGMLEAGNQLTGNDKDWISVQTYAMSGGAVTTSQTWLNHGIPYRFSRDTWIGGSEQPVVTIEAGTKLIFTQDNGIQVGYNDEVGSLKVAGTQEKPVTFTSEVRRAGTWQGLTFTTYAGGDNQIDYAVIEFAVEGIHFEADLGQIVTNTTFRNNVEDRNDD